MTDAEFNLIKPGMTKAEIENVLGRPIKIEPDGSWWYDAINIWEGRVLIYFDSDGRVDYIIT